MRAADFSTFDRRHFLKHLAGLSAMALPGLGFVRTLRAAQPTLKKDHKSIIVLWMSGGPSTIDIWDLKPGEPTGGDFKPRATSVSGVQICEHMPQTAKQMKHLSIIRSLVTNEGSHERGRVLMHTARQPNPITTFPSLGAVASQQLTDPKLALPGFIAVGRPADGPGFLGMNYAPFTVQNPGQPPENIKARLDDDLRIRRRQQLFYAVEDDFRNGRVPHLAKNEEERRKFADASLAHTDIYRKAFNLVASTEGKVFDLRGEKLSVLQDYGNTTFGKGCLLARRLVEAGVTCVEVDLGGWDNHAGIFPTLAKQRLPELDRGMGALVKDLVDRGLWKNTVVVWMGEFGRTPRINQNGGRDHWARCWSVVVGGGAIKGGQVIGSTSKDGLDVKDGKVEVGDLFATLYKGLGIDPALQIRDQIGRPHNISGEGGKPIAALV
jgi:Protein of unknown function (DUF1501)